MFVLDERKPLLTIAIPTWNRAAYLKQNLEQLRLETNGLGSYVDILVSDNCSDDSTSSVVAEAIESGLSIRYVRNEKNIGWGGNFCQCFELAKGRYVILLGDDDLFVDGALSLLIKSLEADNYGVVCLRPYGFDDDFRAEYPGNFGDEREYTIAADFLKDIGALMTLISACAVNVDLVRGLPLKNYFTSDLAHLHLVLHATLNAKKNKFINKYLIACKRNNSASYKFADVFVDQWWGILDAYRSPALDEQAISSIETRMLFSYYPIYLLNIRLTQSEKPKEVFERFSIRFGSRLLFAVWLAPILRLPRVFAIPFGAFVTVVGRIADGDLRRGQAFLRNRVAGMLKFGRG